MDETLRIVNELLGDTAVSLTFCPGEGMDGRSEGLLAWARALAIGTGGRISISEMKGATPFGEPCLSIGDRIHYLSIPEGFELRPFAVAMSGVGSEISVSSDPVSAELIVFTASGCPHCPRAVNVGLDLAIENPGVVCIVADAQRNTALVERFKVQSVPTTILDRGISWTGVLTTGAVVEKLRSRNQPAFRDEVFRSFVASGRLDEAAAMVRAPDGAERFARLWRDSSIASRIPLMLVAEAVLENAPVALTVVVHQLGQSVFSTDAALRGDTVDLLGQIGHPDGVPFVENLLNDPNPDVVEIAEETLERLRNDA